MSENERRIGVRTTVESLDAFRHYFDHPTLSRDQEDLIFSIGQNDPHYQTSANSKIPRDAILVSDLRTHPSLPAFLAAFSERDRQRSEALLRESNSLTEYLLRHYQKRVGRIAFATHKRTIGISLQDLFQEGNIGLTRAINSYDPKRISPTTNKPAAFSTFSTTVIRNTIITEVRKRHRKLGTPLHVAHALKRYHNEVESLTRELGAPPTESQIRERFSSLGVVAPELVELFLKNDTGFMSPQSLNALREGGDQTAATQERIDRLPSAPLETASVADFEAEMLASFLDRLPDAERSVLLRRGYGGGEKQSLRAIAARENISHEKVRQIEWKAIEMLRQLLHAEIRGDEPPGSIEAPDHKYKSHFREQDRAELQRKKQQVADRLKHGETGTTITEATGASKGLIYSVRKSLREGGELPPPPDPKATRETIIGLIDEGKSDIEVAVALNKPVSTVVSIRRARKLFKTNPERFKNLSE